MNIKKCFLGCFLAFLAAAFQAFGVYNIHAQSAITEGGVLGLTLLLDHLLHISPALSSLILNALCYFLGFRTMGKRFLLFSAFAVLGFSVGYGICEQFPPLFPGISDYSLAASLLGALFVGIGSGVCVRIGGAVSGDDALAMSLARLWRKDIRLIYLLSDFSVLLASLCYIPVTRIAWSVLTVLLSGQIIGLIQKIKVPG